MVYNVENFSTDTISIEFWSHNFIGLDVEMCRLYSNNFININPTFEKKKLQVFFIKLVTIKLCQGK